MSHKTIIAPSLMCADLLNLETSIQELKDLGLDWLHLDVIDGHFSPAMPLGIDTIKSIRNNTDMFLDVHLMTKNNEFFVEEMIKIGVNQITFHIETTLHIDQLINQIRKAGIQVGVALNPTTDLGALNYIAEKVDTVLLMLINPGYATFKDETQVAYASRKLEDLVVLRKDMNLDFKIQVDGRVSMDTITNLVSKGADNLVVGSTGLFIKGNSLKDNLKTLEENIERGESSAKK